MLFVRRSFSKFLQFKLLQKCSHDSVLFWNKNIFPSDWLICLMFDALCDTYFAFCFLFDFLTLRMSDLFCYEKSSCFLWFGLLSLILLLYFLVHLIWDIPFYIYIFFDLNNYRYVKQAFILLLCRHANRAVSFAYRVYEAIHRVCMCWCVFSI